MCDCIPGAYKRRRLWCLSAPVYTNMTMYIQWVVLYLMLCVYCSLSELEMTRDDLLIQLYQSSEAFVDKNTVS